MFSKKVVKKTAVDFKEKSNEVLGIFTNTIRDLTTINKEMEDRHTENDIKMVELEDENETLEATAQENALVIDKLNDIINPSIVSEQEY
tara:strand:- start:11899 stop:12165 length:267 start_codon:yes stop_codon:yes gene_type:complete